MLKLGHCGKLIRITLRVLKCAGKNREEQLDRWCENWSITQSQGGKNILHAIKWKKVKWIGHIWGRNCLLEHVTEGKLEGRVALLGRRGRRCQMLLVDLREMRDDWKLKGEALYRTLWRIQFGRGCGLSCDRIQINEGMSDSDLLVSRTVSCILPCFLSFFVCM